MVAAYRRDQGTASHEGKDEMHPVPQACVKCAGDADLVIEAVELGRVTYVRKAVTQLVGSPKQVRRDTGWSWWFHFHAGITEALCSLLLTFENVHFGACP